jgi:Co/Zn/Cd efflux system component
MILYLATPIWHKVGVGEEAILTPYYMAHMKGTLAEKSTAVFYLAVLAVLSAGVSIFIIFQYKNRVRQMLFVALNSLIGAALLGTTVYHIQFEATKYFAPEQQGEFGIGFWSAFAALVFNWIANRMIRKDEKTVRDADRMR